MLELFALVRQFLRSGAISPLGMGAHVLSETSSASLEEALAPSLMPSLERVVAVTRASEDPWWLIGSAAMALHGLRQLKVADIDLLMSRADARRLLQDHGQPETSDGGTEHFRSDIFGRLPGRPLSIDVMGGFHVRKDGAWREVIPITRVAIRIPSGLVFVPAAHDLLDITRLMGGEKDRHRAAMLEKLL